MSQHSGILEDSAALFTDEEAEPEREVISSKVTRGRKGTPAFLFPQIERFPPLYDDCSNHYHL